MHPRTSTHIFFPMTSDDAAPFQKAAFHFTWFKTTHFSLLNLIILFLFSYVFFYYLAILPSTRTLFYIGNFHIVSISITIITGLSTLLTHTPDQWRQRVGLTSIFKLSLMLTGIPWRGLRWFGWSKSSSTASAWNNTNKKQPPFLFNLEKFVFFLSHKRQFLYHNMSHKKGHGFFIHDADHQV